MNLHQGLALLSLSMLSLTACPGSGAKLPDGDLTVARSGERLHARFIEGDGGADLLDFIDEETNQGCAFIETTEELRCVPLARGAVYYADAHCSQALALTMAGAPPLVTTQRSVLRLGAKWSGGQVYTTFQDDCVPLSGAPPGEVREVTEELGFDDFVRGEVIELDEGLRLARLGVLGEDGAWAPGGWRDRLLDAECFGQTPTAPLSGRCALPSYSSSRPLRDERCQRPAVFGGRSIGAHIIYQEATPDRPQQIYPVLQRLDHAQARMLLADGSCVPLPSALTSALPTAEVYALGEPFDLDHLARLDRTSEGSGALRRGGYRTEDGRFGTNARGTYSFGLPVASFAADLVQADGSACQPIFLAGELRCAPIAAVSGPEQGARSFSDAQCSVPVVLTGKGATGYVLPGFQRSAEPFGLFVAAELLALGEAIEPQAHHSLDGQGACRATPLPEPGDLEGHLVGGPVDPSTLLRLALRVE